MKTTRHHLIHVIESIPPAWERKCDEQQWKQVLPTERGLILGYLAGSLVHMWSSAFPDRAVPPGFDGVMGYIHEVLKSEVEWREYGYYAMASLSLCEIGTCLWDILHDSAVATITDDWASKIDLEVAVLNAVVSIKHDREI